MRLDVRDLRRRIRSSEKVRRICRAMEQVAAARLARSRHLLAASQPYLERMQAVVRPLVAAAGTREAEPGRLGRKAVVVFGPDRGLCGRVTRAIVAAAEEAMASWPGARPHLAVVGRVTRVRLRARGLDADAFFEQPRGNEMTAQLDAIVATYVDGFLAGSYSGVTAVYSHFESPLMQVPTAVRVLPVSMKEEGVAVPGVAGAAVSECEPGAAELLELALPELGRARMLHAFFHSLLSELAARQMGMSRASANAETLKGELTLAYNRARQESITTELLDIAVGRMR